jgi:predicted nucleotidyltransferase
MKEENNLKWRKAFEKFIKKWKKKKEVIGIVVAGSYITGTPTVHSDIDIFIILAKGTKWRERGNQMVDGFLMEYFANPIEQYYKYAENYYQNRRKVSSHMLISGEIILNRDVEVNKLIKYSQKMIHKNFVKLKKFEVESLKYELWDNNDNLQEVFEIGDNDFFFVYYNFLNKLFQIYGAFLRFESLDIHKIKKILIKSQVRKKYDVVDFPDAKFKKDFLKALKLKKENQMALEFNQLTNYVLEKMGGFTIDNWRLKSRLK